MSASQTWFGCFFFFFFPVVFGATVVAKGGVRRDRKKGRWTGFEGRKGKMEGRNVDIVNVFHRNGALCRLVVRRAHDRVLNPSGF